jgi:hypothetical protein
MCALVDSLKDTTEVEFLKKVQTNWGAVVFATDSLLPSDCPICKKPNYPWYQKRIIYCLDRHFRHEIFDGTPLQGESENLKERLWTLYVLSHEKKKYYKNLNERYILDIKKNYERANFFRL